MPSPKVTTSPDTLQPALELIYLATLQPELASQSLRKLLLANPEYFSSLPERSFQVVLNINGDTAFESLGCVSYVPLLNQLYASIQVKRDWGYSLAQNHSNSREYVRFYLSSDGGATWHNEGLTAFSVGDEPGARPRIHIITKRIDLSDRIQFAQYPPLVRAILSWNTPPPPDTPDWTPLWGNVLDTQILNVRADACRTDRLQPGSWGHFAGETVSEERVGRPSDLSDSGPTGVPAPAGRPSRTRNTKDDYQVIGR